MIVSSKEGIKVGPKRMESKRQYGNSPINMKQVNNKKHVKRTYALQLLKIKPQIHLIEVCTICNVGFQELAFT